MSSEPQRRLLATGTDGPWSIDPQSKWLADSQGSALLKTTARPEDINPAHFDAIYFTGGQGVMWGFPDGAVLQRITRDIYERGGVMSSVCQGYCGLFNARLPDGN